MGLFRKKPNVLIASGQRVRLDNSDEVKRAFKRRGGDWQDRAWNYFDLIGELKEGVRYQGDMLAKVRLFAGERPPDDPDGDPVKTDNEVAIEAVRRLDGPGGGQAQIMRMSAMNLTVAGEGYLIGLDATGDEPERWEFHSINDVKLKGNNVLLVEADDGSPGRVLTEGRDFFNRIWLAHPNRAALPDSPVNGVLSSCELVVMLERTIQATLLSRIALAGIFLMPKEATADNIDPSILAAFPGLDPTMAMMLNHMTVAIRDPGSAAAAAPLLLKADAAHIDKFKQLVFERPIDSELLARLDTAIERIGRGINLPEETVTGKGDLNHWNYWGVTEDEFKGYFEPLTRQICGALTRVYFRPMLEEDQRFTGDPSRFDIWYDASDLIVQPNRQKSASEGHDRLVVSDQAWRDAHGFDDEDAPDEDEVARRIAIQQATRRSLSDGGGQGPPDNPNENSAAVVPLRSVVAAAPLDGAQLGRRLAEIDRQVRRDVLVAADAALARALERVGARLRSKAQRDGHLMASLSGVDQTQVAAHLGPALVATLDVGDLLEGAFAKLRPKFDQFITRAQRAVLRLIPQLSAADVDAAVARQDLDRAEAWTYLESQLLDLAKTRMYSPEVEVPALGEIDTSTAIPYGIVRAAVTLAGGGKLQEVGAAPAASGIGNGAIVRELLTDQGATLSAFQWDYGVFPRERPFEPHAALDGVVFKNFDDDVLVNTEGWPETAFYFAGDHEGCVCDFLNIWELPAPPAAEQPLAASLNA